MSNHAYSQAKIAEYLSFFFSIIGIGSSIIASEVNRYYNENDENKTHIIRQMLICNMSTVLLIVFIVIDYQMFIQWQKTKL
jgi:cell division protein FtsW (lipid II flippase)